MLDNEVVTHKEEWSVRVVHGPEDLYEYTSSSFNDALEKVLDLEESKYGVRSLERFGDYAYKFTNAIQYGTDYDYVVFTKEGGPVRDVDLTPDDVVECEAQGELFSAEDVDDTARFIPHPAWSLFGDQINQETL